MASWLKPGHKIGIIGEGKETAEVILAAKKIGYHVSTYNPYDQKVSGSISDIYVEGNFDDAEKLMAFSETVDILIYTTRSIDSDLIKKLSDITEVPQGDFLLSLSQDKILRKSVLEMNSNIVVPQDVIVSKDDLYKAIENIGFPAVLKSNSSWNRTFKQKMFYEMSDIDAFDFDSANVGVGILEAWVPVERELTVVVSVDNNDNVFPVTLSETSYREGKLYRSFNPPEVDDEVAIQTFYSAQEIATINDFYGTLSVEFLKTAADVLYVKDITPFVSPSATYTKYSQNLSQYDMFIRSIVGWPIPSVVHYSPAMTVQFYDKHKDKIFQEIKRHPEWLIDLHDNDMPDSPIGSITVVSSETQEVLQDFAEVDLWNNKNNEK